MIATSRKPRLPLKYHGGESYLARRIIAIMPPTRAYAEHFAGGMSVGLNLDPLPYQLANDLDDDLMNFWDRLKVAIDDGLLDAIRSLSYSAGTFEAARRDDAPDPDSRALAYLVARRMSRGKPRTIRRILQAARPGVYLGNSPIGRSNPREHDA